MEDTTKNDNSEFHLRFNAARLLARPSEFIRFDGESKTAKVGEDCLLSVELDEERLVITMTPTACEDEALLESLAALPCESCPHAEISVYRRDPKLMPLATVPLRDALLGRVELQRIREALEAHAGRIASVVSDRSEP